jgi:hypothetical protein
MAKQVINSNSVEPIGPPNLGTSVEQGDTWNQAVTKINANFTDLYGNGIVAGAGTATFGGSGLINKTVGPVGSGNTNTSQTLASYTLPASTLASAGQQIVVTAWGTVANNAAPKSIVMNIGGTTVTTGTQTGAAYSWWLQGQYMLDASNAESYLFTGQASGGAVTQKAGTDTSVNTGTIATNLVITDASAATSNVTLLGYVVEYFA